MMALSFPQWLKGAAVQSVTVGIIDQAALLMYRQIVSVVFKCIHLMSLT